MKRQSSLEVCRFSFITEPKKTVEQAWCLSHGLTIAIRGGLLLPESYGAGFRIHRVYNGERLQLVAQAPDETAAGLEAFFNNDAQSFNGGTRILGNGDEAQQGAAIGKEVINDQNPVIRAQELLGDDNLVAVFVGKGLHFRDIHISVKIYRLGLFGKNHGNAKLLRHKGSNADAGGFNGHNLGNRLVGEATLEFPADLLHQGDVHLVVQEAVHFQYITGLDNAVF